MELRPWRDRLTAELARRGVPVGHRARLLAELGDHIDDLTEEGGAMTEAMLEAKLGRPDELAAAALVEYRRASWIRRHPFMVFGLTPVPVAVLAVAVCELALALVMLAVSALAGGELPRAWLVPGVVAASYVAKFAPFVVAAVWYGRLASRHEVRWGWRTAAIVQVALIGGAFVSRVIVSDVPGESTWAVGFSLPLPDDVRALAPFFWAPDWGQLAQLAAPLLSGWLFVQLARRRATVLVAA